MFGCDVPVTVATPALHGDLAQRRMCSTPWGGGPSGCLRRRGESFPVRGSVGRRVGRRSRQEPRVAGRGRALPVVSARAFLRVPREYPDVNALQFVSRLCVLRRL